MSAAAALIAAYRDAFERGDADAIVDCFGETVHVLTDTGTGVRADFVSHVEWRGVVWQLLEHYRAIGVAGIQVRGLETTELSPRLALATVTWALIDRRGETLYVFHAVYTLINRETGWRIGAIAHDERAQGY